MTLTVRKMGRRWWIVGYEDEEFDGPMGPYNTKVEAESGARGVRRFLRHQDEAGYFTCDPPQKGER